MKSIKEMFTLNDLLMLNNELSNIYKTKMSAKLAFKLKTLMSLLKPHLTILEETRNKFLKNYETKITPLNNGDNNVSFVNDDDQLSFLKEYGELLNEEVELTFKPISIESFDDIEVTPSLLELLKGFLVD